MQYAAHDHFMQKNSLPADDVILVRRSQQPWQQLEHPVRYPAMQPTNIVQKKMLNDELSASILLLWKMYARISSFKKCIHSQIRFDWM